MALEEIVFAQSSTLLPMAKNPNSHADVRRKKIKSQLFSEGCHCVVDASGNSDQKIEKNLICIFVF